MFIRTSDGFADGDFADLKCALALLDEELSRVSIQVQQSADPDSDGLCDRGEYLIGLGFTAIQRYMACTYGQFKLTKAQALQLPPATPAGTAVAAAINAGANYWKHLDEWGLRAAVTRDTALLPRPAQQTIETIEELTPWADYTLANLLAALNESGTLSLSMLLPSLVLWRSAIDSLHRESS